MGLVERGFSEEDRREVKLKLTTRGEEVSKESSRNSLSYKAMLSALEKMSEEDIQSLLRIQKELLDHLTKSGY
jgi:DNA-binding MarR family transcriptional regulator